MLRFQLDWTEMITMCDAASVICVLFKMFYDRRINIRAYIDQVVCIDLSQAPLKWSMSRNKQFTSMTLDARNASIKTKHNSQGQVQDQITINKGHRVKSKSGIIISCCWCRAHCE